MFHSRQFMKICSKQSCACTWVCWGMSLHEALSHLCHGTTTPTGDVLSESAQLTKMGEKNPANSLLFCQIWLKSITGKPGHRLFQTFGLIGDELIRNTSQVFWAKLRMSLERRRGKKWKKEKREGMQKPKQPFFLCWQCHKAQLQILQPFQRQERLRPSLCCPLALKCQQQLLPADRNSGAAGIIFFFLQNILSNLTAASRTKLS